MSTASEETSSDQPQRTSHQPGPLAILAATALGSVIATRIGKAPLLFAAGAAAMAMLSQKKYSAPPAKPQSLPPPAPPPEIPAQSLVEQWLSQQIIREKQAPAVDFSTDEITPSEPEDDYRPESFLLDEFDQASNPRTADNDSFAGLTEPAPQQVQELAPQFAEIEAEPEAPAPPTPPAIADAAWTLGVDPMPSLNENAPYVAPVGSRFFSTPVRQKSPTSVQEPPCSNMFSTAPLRHEEPGPPLFFSNAVFQGGAFPDEIQVAPASEAVSPRPLPPSPADAPWVEPEPFVAPLPAAVATPEIPVELAAPGDASFDPPLAAALHNPWQPAPEVFAMSPAVPVQTQTNSTLVEAEIILRPRAPTQNSVTAKSNFAPQGFGKHFSAESNATSTAENPNDAHFPGPLNSQHDPKPQPTWRSWWRGD